MRDPRILTLLVAALALACQAPARPDTASSSTEVAAPLEVAPPPAVAKVAVRDAAGAEAPYRVGELEKLAVDVRVTGAQPGPRTFQLEVMSPRGTLYATLPLAIQVDASGEGGATEELQVRGTSIERFHRAGAWVFRVRDPSAGAAIGSGEALVAE